MATVRTIRQVVQSRPTLEGAGVHVGVHLRRAFAYERAKRLDPFLLLADFHSRQPADYLMGFPWHPHRGMETIPCENRWEDVR
jgi:redox-sensitive bicupin YhaK (pirin superfamily)